MTFDKFMAWYSKHPVRNFWLSMALAMAISLVLDRIGR